MGEKLMDQVSGQVKEIKKLVVLNQDTLLALHTNRDKPEIFNEVMRKVKRMQFSNAASIYTNVHVCYKYVVDGSDSEDLLARTVIVGIIMAFRKLTLDALNNVLTYRVPFILSSIKDFKKNLPDKTSTVCL